MTESVSSSSNVSLSVLSELKSFLRSGKVKSESEDNTNEENKTAGNRDVARKALSKLLEKSYNSNLQTVKRNAEEKMQNDANTTNPLKVNTPERDAQSALSIKRPEVNAETNNLRVNTPERDAQSALSIRRPEVNAETNNLRVNTPERDAQSALSIKRPEVNAETNNLRVNTPERDAQSALSIKRPEVNAEANNLRVDTPERDAQSALSIKRPETDADFDPLKVNVQSSNAESALKINVQEKETETETVSSSIPKQKQAILYELKNTMHLKYSAWDIAKKYGISYLQAQEIFVDLNQDANGVVKEFNLPENSTVSYLV